MKTFSESEREIVALLSKGTTFSFQSQEYTVILSGKPTCSAGEPKTDIYVLTQSENGFEREFKVSFKQENADFIENKTSADRAEALFGVDWQNVIMNSTQSIATAFDQKPLVYKNSFGRTEAGAITLGWKYELMNKTSGELSGAVSLSKGQILDVYAGTHLPKDKRNAQVGGQTIIDSGIANFMIFDSKIHSIEDFANSLQGIDEYIGQHPEVYFACKALNYRTFKDKFDGNRPLAVFVDWSAKNGKLHPVLRFDAPLVTKGNAVAEKLKTSLKSLNIKTTDDINLSLVTDPSKIYT